MDDCFILDFLLYFYGGEGLKKIKYKPDSCVEDCITYIRENEQELSKNASEPETEILTVGEESVICYFPENFPTVGVWMQNEDGHIMIYAGHPSGEAVFYRDVQHDGEKGPMHQHGCIEIGYVLEGCARQSFFGKEYKFSQGDFWIVDRNCSHSDVYSKSKLTTIYIGVSQEILDMAFMGKVNNSEIQNFLKTALLEQKAKRQFLAFHQRLSSSRAPAVMEKLFVEAFEQDAGYENIIKGLLERLIESLSMEYDYHLNSEEKKMKRKLLFQEMERYIHENYMSVTISDLEDKFYYNKDYYNRLFKEHTGVTYSEYLKNVRLSFAENMLKTTTLSIEEIMAAIGYQSRAYFHRIFEERNGVTPAKYRKKYWVK